MERPCLPLSSHMPANLTVMPGCQGWGPASLRVILVIPLHPDAVELVDVPAAAARACRSGFRSCWRDRVPSELVYQGIVSSCLPLGGEVGECQGLSR
jgi:hypothetical protein